MVFLANPNNPTGTYISIDEVRELRSGLPAHVLLVLDAAYAEYVQRNDYEAGIELVATTANTVMTRTFSKIHGLAGLRLGWAYCPEAVADALEPHPRAVQRLGSGARRRRRRDRGRRRTRRRRLSTTSAGAPWLGGRDREAGAEGEPERRQLPARAFSATPAKAPPPPTRS